MKNSHSEIKISPRTWEKNLKSNLKKEWYGYYYFYSTKYPLGKLIKFKGMNRIKNLEDRQNLTKYLINNEIDMLSRGYNPVTKEFETSDNFITEHTPILKSIGNRKNENKSCIFYNGGHRIFIEINKESNRKNRNINFRNWKSKKKGYKVNFGYSFRDELFQ